MKKIAFAIVGAASLALAACGGQGDDAAGDAIEDNMEAQAENLDALADNAAGAEADALANQADQLEEQGEKAEEAVDDADTTNQNEVDAAVNGM